MEYRIMTESDIPLVTPLYMAYYNEKEEGEWTAQTVYKRIHQVLSREDPYCLVLGSGQTIIAFAIGYFEQYDDGFAYDLVEIVVASDYQNQGIGTQFMEELERRVKEKGAMLIQLQSVNDAFHEHFYKKLGFRTASNLVLKTKMIGSP